jgi:hypothetical protein
MRPRDVTGKCAVRNCGDAYTEWNYDTMGSDNFCTNLNYHQKTVSFIVTAMKTLDLTTMKFLTPNIKTDYRM